MKNYIFILSVALVSCNGLFNQEKASNFQLDVYHLENLFEFSNDSINLEELKNELGYFWDVYAEHILYLPEAAFYDSLSSLKNEKYFQEAFQSISTLYSDFSLYENEFSSIMKRYSEYFPNENQPKIVTFFGAFNYPVVVTDSVLGIGLEMFLGEKSNYYSDLSNKYPPYMHQNFQPSHLTSLAINGWFESDYPVPTKSFLDQIVHHGKLKYVVYELTQNSESAVMGYSSEQIDWCYENEYSIYRFIIEQGLLYTNDQFIISRYTTPAPYSKGMPKESPGQVSNWIGWQIVKKFMKNNPEISLNQLLDIDDGQYILQQSKYKPK